MTFPAPYGGEWMRIQGLIGKAHDTFREGESHKKLAGHDLAIRRMQEAAELFVKAVFGLVGQAYPKSHDLQKGVLAIRSTLNGFEISDYQIARLLVAYDYLTNWRQLAFYGDEQLGVSRVFTKKEADLASDYAMEIKTIVDILMARAFRAYQDKEKVRT